MTPSKIRSWNEYARKDKIKKIRNTRKDAVTFTYNGETKSLMAWALGLKMSYYLLYARLFRYTPPWDVEKAFNTPAVRRTKKSKK